MRRHDLARELLEEIDSPCPGASEISTGGAGSWGGCLLLPSMTGKLNPDRLAVRAFAGEVLRTRIRPDFH
jgi:hypothetical protein